MRILDSDGHYVRVKPFLPVTSAVITTTTAVTVKTAVSAKRLFITQVTVTNKTTGEYPVIKIATSNATTPVLMCTLTPGTPTAAETTMKSAKYKWDPYYEIPAGETLTGESLVSAKGDSYVTAMGFVEV